MIKQTRAFDTEEEFRKSFKCSQNLMNMRYPHIQLNYTYQVKNCYKIFTNKGSFKGLSANIRLYASIIHIITLNETHPVSTTAGPLSGAVQYQLCT